MEKRFDASPATIADTRLGAEPGVDELIDNAADASPVNGQIEIATWNEPEWLAISITDHGHGIPEDVKTAYLRGVLYHQAARLGHRTGLEIVHRIVTHKFGGQIDVESKPGETRFTVMRCRGRRRHKHRISPEDQAAGSA